LKLRENEERTTRSDYPEMNTQENVGDFIIVKALGQGSSSTVYLAKKGDYQYVLKQISKKNLKFNRKHLRREITINKLIRHERVVEFIGHFETQDDVFLVMEYFPGLTLLQFMQARKFRPLREPMAVRIFAQIVQGLLACHTLGIVHLDIKLENIMVNQNFEVKLIDFNLSDLIISPTQLCKHWVGSLPYIPPEVKLRKQYSGFKADVFSLGCVLFGLIFCYFPFPLEDTIDEANAPALTFPSDIPISDGLQDLMRQMQEFDPVKRIPLTKVAKHQWVRPDDNGSNGAQP